MPSVLNPINITPTIVRQPIPILPLLGLILSTARTTTPLPPFLSVRQSSLNVFLYPRALLLRAAAPPTDTSLVLLIPRADDKYANKRTTGTDIRGKYWGRLKAELTPRSHKRSSTLPLPPPPPVLPRQC